MPTTTTTTIRPLETTHSISLVIPPPPMVQTSKAAALRSLYNRAARAFVLRDITLTYSLLQSAFALLNPPTVLPDPLSDHRRKWDILRITFESTVYTSPPSSTESLPETLRTNLMESPQALATSIYSRSLALFTPSSGLSKTALSAAYLPCQVLSTLVYCTLKIDAPDIGRIVIEDWLARREPQYPSNRPEELESDGYEKALELYTLHVLPKLEQWDYAREFLEYESELTSQRREYLRSSLNSLYTQAMARQPFQWMPLPTATSTSQRSHSPAPSCSSSSSSLSNTSTHTVVPSTHRGKRSSDLSALTSLSQPFSSLSSSVSSSKTATPRALHTSLLPNGDHQPSKSRTSSTSCSLPRSSLAHQAAASPANLNTYTLIRASLAPYLTSKRMTTFLLLFLLVPLLSFLLRMRRRKRLLNLSGAVQMTAGANAAAGHADLVRRRLKAAGGRVEGSLLGRAWADIVRVVGDTVKMAGSGLV